MDDKAISRLLEDINFWRQSIPSIVHPVKALSVSRISQKGSAQDIAEFIGISRSYLASLENFNKPITSDFYYDYLSKKITKKNLSSNKKIAPTFDTLDKFYSFFRGLDLDEKLNSICNIISWFEKTITDDLAYQLAHLILEALTNLPYVEVVWEKPLNKSTLRNLEEKEQIKFPSNWPSGCLPRLIIVTNKSLIFAWIAGLISSEEIIKCYANDNFPSFVLMQRKENIIGQIKISGLIALSLFIFDEIFIEARTNIYYQPPIQLSAMFNSKPLYVLRNININWFTFEDLIPLKDLKEM